MHGHSPALRHMLSANAGYCECAHCEQQTAAYFITRDRPLIHIPWAKVSGFYTRFSGSYVREREAVGVPSARTP